MTTKKNQLQVLLDGCKDSVTRAKSYLKTYNLQLDDFQTRVQLAVAKETKLHGCELRSLKRAVNDACMLGLVPDGREAALVPFKGQVSLIPMVDGLMRIGFEDMDMEIRSGAIYRGDGTKIHQSVGGDDSKSTIEKTYSEEFLAADKPELIGAWAIGERKGGGGNYVLVLNKKQIEKAQLTGNSTAWRTWPERMAQKSAVKRLVRETLYLRGEKNGQRLRNAAFYEDEQDEIIDVSDGVIEGEFEQVEDEPAPKPAAKKPAAKKPAAKKKPEQDQGHPQSENPAPPPVQEPPAQDAPLDIAQPPPADDDTNLQFSLPDSDFDPADL